MKIKDLPPKLRNLAKIRLDRSFRYDDFLRSAELRYAFMWNKTPEGLWFWGYVNDGAFEKAYNLRPDLREPFCGESQNGNKSPNEYDYINPDHYKKGDKEVWEMMVDIWGVEKYIAHCEMCAFKYRQRLGLKPDQPIERDLEKAKWYESKAKELSDGMD